MPVITGPDGQEIVWSNVDLRRATAAERSLYGAAIHELRMSRGMTQEDLGFAASVSPRTIRNIERGQVTAQAEVLERLFVALDVELSGHVLRGSTQQWLAIIGPMLDALDDAEQATTVQKLLPILVDAARAPRGETRSPRTERTDVPARSEDGLRAINVDGTAAADDAETPKGGND
jgi:transcriptional regulator with XRE-family HTH domain